MQSHSQALDIYEQLGVQWGISNSLSLLGRAACYLGDFEAAGQHQRRSLILRREDGNRRVIILCLERLAQVASAKHQAERAARLLGAVKSFRQATHLVLSPLGQLINEQIVNSSRLQLTNEAFTAQWAEGESMGFEQTIDYALLIS